jgi:DNA-binding transcriptional LysR family regulator
MDAGMELRHLRYFVSVAEELNFTRAAARLGIAQPPLSQQIAKLEREIGTRLFHRAGRGVTLTDAGAQFLSEARLILERVERATRAAREIGEGNRGLIRIGFTSAASFNPFVPRAISEYRAAFPDVEIQLQENTTSVLLPELRERRLDVAFLRQAEGEAEDLPHHFILAEEMLIAVPAAHPLATRKKASLSVFADEPFITFPRANGRSLYDAIVAACKEAGFEPRVIQEVPQMASTINLVATGIGVTLVPASMRQLHSEGVKYLRIDGPAPSASLSLASRGDPLPPTAEHFIRLVLHNASLHAA